MSFFLAQNSDGFLPLVTSYIPVLIAGFVIYFFFIRNQTKGWAKAETEMAEYKRHRAEIERQLARIVELLEQQPPKSGN